MLTREEISEFAQAISAFARTAEDGDLDLVRSLRDAIEASYRTELSRRKEYEVLLERIAQRSRESEPSESKRRALTLEELAQRALESERKREDRVDLHQNERYGESTLLTDRLKPPSEYQRLEEVLERATALEGENASLRIINQGLRDEIAEVRGKIASLTGKTEPASGAVEAADSETKSGLEDFPEVDLSGVPLFGGVRGADPMAHLQIHYGQWLKYFGAKRDMVWLPQVRKHDIKLVKALQNYITRKDIAGLPQAVGDIIPTQTQLGDALLRGKTVEEVMQNPRLAHLLHARLQNALYFEQQREGRKLMPSRRTKK